MIERSEKLVAKVKSERLKTEGKIESEKIKSVDNSRNLPNDVTIREEYVKCGKPDCKTLDRKKNSNFIGLSFL